MASVVWGGGVDVGTGWISVQPESGGPSRSVRPTTIQPAPDRLKAPSEKMTVGRAVHPQQVEPEDQKVLTSSSSGIMAPVHEPPRRGRPPKRKKIDTNGEKIVVENEGCGKWAKREVSAAKTDRASETAVGAAFKGASEWGARKHTKPLHDSTLVANSNADSIAAIDVEVVDGIPIIAVEERAWRATHLFGLDRDHEGGFGNGGGSMTEFLSAQAAEIAKLENQLARMHAQLDARQATREASEESVRQAAVAVAVAAAAEAQEASAAMAARRAKKRKKLLKTSEDTISDDCAAAELLRLFGGPSQNGTAAVADTTKTRAPSSGAHQAPENQPTVQPPKPQVDLVESKELDEPVKTTAPASTAVSSSAAAVLDTLSEDVNTNEDGDGDEDADEDVARNSSRENKGKGKKRRSTGEAFNSKSQRSTRKDATTCAWLAKLFVVLHRGQPPPSENDTNRAAALSNDTITATFAVAAQAAATAIATAAAHVGNNDATGSSSSSSRNIMVRGSGEKSSASKCAAIAAQAAANATRKPGADLLESSALTAAVAAVSWCGPSEFDTLHWSSNGEAVSVACFLLLVLAQTLDLILSKPILLFLSILVHF